ncbi:MAG TPA: class I SAM-dependent methyltransferase [Ktedonobacterales bacterium]|nr:class I SAM-dependent methyltransferase [Ktedonobacterales bacterium]
MTVPISAFYSTRMEHYVIKGGRVGYERLLLLARDRWPDTRALLTRAGVGAGMRCVDLGCGGGEVTFELARLVAPDGFAVGVDMDEVKLALAREAATERGVANVEFRAANVNTWDEPATYDVVYSRFLLQHLSQPVALLRRMWAAVRPGGVIVVEDADHDGWSCHPPNVGFDFFVNAFCHALDRAGGDHAIGRKLYSYFLDAGIPDPQVALIQPLHIADEGKALPLSTLDATTPAILELGLATEDAVNAAREDLAAYIADPRSLILGPRDFQLWSRR